MTLIDDFLDLQVPRAISISPDARQVVYSTTIERRHAKGEHPLSTLWVAETGKSKTARQLTSGLYNDTVPRWLPDAKSIAFLSDRHKQGERTAVYSLPMTVGGEPFALTSTELEASVDSFEVSPDGKWIAFLSADEKTAEKKAKDKKDDVKVWGDDWPFNRLRLLHVATKKVTTLFSESSHVQELAWNDDGTKIAFATSLTPDLESQFSGHKFFVVHAKTGILSSICSFPSYIGNLRFAGDTLYFLGPVDQQSTESSTNVYSVDLSTDAPTPQRYAHGDEDCAAALQKAGQDVTVMVQRGMQSQISMLKGKVMFDKKQTMHAWNAAFTTDSDELIVAVAVGERNKPPEVYTTTASGGALVQLSSHGQVLDGKKFGTTSFLSCRSSDDEVELEGLYLMPETSGKGKTPSGPHPTVVFIHGGPYSRTSDEFDPAFAMWAPTLLNAGYALMLPNYRGSSGRGEAFAAYSRGGMGIYDYQDVITLTNHVVEKGLADKNRLIVAGWSQGGFLSYLCAVRNGLHGHGWKFKGAIPGAGVTDWDTMCFTSDIGIFEAELAGHRPWESKRDDLSGRQGSAIWEFADAVKKGDVIPPVLILHGEDDKRVPLEQAVAFRRAMEGANLPFEMAVYPREPHVFKERLHLKDMVERMLRFVDKHIG